MVERNISGGPLAFRENQNFMKKQIIADLPLRDIRDGMTIFLGSSSTVYAPAKQLDRFDSLKVVTNRIKTAMLLTDFKNLTVMCIDDSLCEKLKSLVGFAAKDFISRYNADLAFMSCLGFSVEDGTSEASENE